MSNPVVITFGCRLNAHESEVIEHLASGAGLRDAVIVNTCAVTSEAAAQARQTIRKAKRQSPTSRVIVTGCAAQTGASQFLDMPEVDHIIGNQEKMTAKAYAAIASGDAERVAVSDIMAVRDASLSPIPKAATAPRARAIVEVQNGCDHRCTFCVIPFGRGPSRSIPVEKVVDEIARLTREDGYREVVLTGVDLTSYGADLAERPTLGVLVKAILRAVPDLPRLRLSSIDQVEADDHLLEALANEPRLMPHLHLSLQAGDDLILKRMKRRHNRDQSIRFCEDVRKLRPDIVFGADFIAGFPTETDAMFENTLDLVDDCGLTYLHVFPYSKRPGTPAARMPEVAAPEIRDRAKRLRAKGEDRRARFLNRFDGANVEVLVERGGIGRTPEFAEVEIGDERDVGSLKWAAIASHDGKRLKGTLLS